MCVCVCVYDEFIEPWNCWELAILEKCYQNGQHKHTNIHMHNNSHRCTEEKRARASGRELMKESQEEKKQKMLAGIHCSLFLWPPFTAVVAFMLLFLCCCWCCCRCCYRSAWRRLGPSNRRIKAVEHHWAFIVASFRCFFLRLTCSMKAASPGFALVKCQGRLTSQVPLALKWLPSRRRRWSRSPTRSSDWSLLSRKQKNEKNA